MASGTDAGGRPLPALVRGLRGSGPDLDGFGPSPHSIPAVQHLARRRLRPRRVRLPVRRCRKAQVPGDRRGSVFPAARARPRPLSLLPRACDAGHALVCSAGLGGPRPARGGRAPGGEDRRRCDRGRVGCGALPGPRRTGLDRLGGGHRRRLRPGHSQLERKQPGPSGSTARPSSSWRSPSICWSRRSRTKGSWP